MSLKNLPNTDLYITRKRKKWKFAHFDSYPNCFTLKRGDDGVVLKAELNTFFTKKQPLILEIAAGNAQFSLALARLHPEYNFVAIDIKSDRLYTSAKQALEEGVGNIIFVRTHINELPKIFKEKSVHTIWLTFPDPFPRKRSAKHRLTHQSFLRQYSKILEDTGRLKFKTDNRELFLWSLEQFVNEKWHLEELSFDLHDSKLSEEYKIKTYYETRFLNEGLTINYCTAS